LRHATKRNVVERIFGVLQKRFPILTKTTSNFSVETQVDLVLALCGLHNFLMRNGGRDDAFGVEEVAIEEEEDEENLFLYGNDAAAVGDWRDDIARAMWDQYQDHLNM
jgi:hypothetical protein